MPTTQPRHSSDWHNLSYLAEKTPKLIEDLWFLFSQNRCEPSTLELFAEQIRINNETTLEQIQIMMDHEMPAIRKIGRYAMAEQSDVTVIQLLQMFNLTLFHQDAEPGELGDTSFFANKIIEHPDVNVWQLKLVSKKLDSKLLSQAEFPNTSDLETQIRLGVVIKQMEV
jgi:hypothetical protein